MVFALVVVAFFLPSCSPDCKEVTLKKPVWNTRYEEYWTKEDTVITKAITKDTLVPYSISQYWTEQTYKKNANGQPVTDRTYHYITIHNNSETYSNYFAIQITGKEYVGNRWRDFRRNSGYASIGPNCSYTFGINHSNYWREEGRFDEANVSINILQEPQRAAFTKQIVTIKDKKHIRRIDEMTFKDTIVNNCECDIDALKAEYKAIQEVYERLKKEQLIKEDNP